MLLLDSISDIGENNKLAGNPVQVIKWVNKQFISTLVKTFKFFYHVNYNNFHN